MLLVLATVMISGCGPNKQQVLEFFFTGVPPKEKQAEPQTVEKTPGGAPRPAMAIASAHSYFVHRECTRCHGSSMSIILSGSERQARRASEQALGAGGPGYPVIARQLCLNCHEDPFEGSGRQALDKHPPVGCTVCHRPHQSEHRYLLRETPQKVCAMCHPNNQMDATGFHHKPLRS